MIYVQFFDQKRVPEIDDETGEYTGLFRLPENEYQEAVGDRAVIILDGRNTRQNMLDISAHEMTKRGYKAFQLVSGDSFTRSIPISTLYTE